MHGRPLLLAAMALGWSGGHALAEVTLTNAVGSPVRVQYGYADQNGMVEWTPFVMEPCFSLTFKEAPNLRLLFPRFVDERLNPDTGGIDYELILLNQPGTPSLFLADPRIMINVFSGIDCVAAEGPPAKPVPPPP